MSALLRDASPSVQDLLRLAPELFYAQTWYAGEAFMSARAGTSGPLPPPTPRRISGVPGAGGEEPPPSSTSRVLPSASDLAWAYCCAPHAPSWRWWLWTRDVDRHGQRVYVGAPHGAGFEIHRHLHVTDRWRVPDWDAPPGDAENPSP